jgi:anti-anti-sigma regulatory factor
LATLILLSAIICRSNDGFFSVTTEYPILVGIFDGFSWIRCEGKGSFLNSPALKAFGFERITAGETCLVVDLQACTGMDSTFMGTLAGMASRLTAHEGAVLQIADASERNRHSLEDLGLDFLMEIDPKKAVWSASVEAIRSALTPHRPAAALGQIQQTKHVLEAHKVLSETNERNLRAFSNVVTLLESELETKQKRAETPGEKS